MLRQFKLHYGNDGEGEAVGIPLFLRMITLAALNENGPSCVFVVPQPELIAHMVALLGSLLDTKLNFSQRCQDFMATGLKEKQRVQLLPDREIYEYGGLVEYGGNHRIQLNLLGKNSNNGSRTLHVNEALRLVPTERKRPLGKGKTNASELQLTDFDRLLGIAAYDNPAVFRNRIILHTSRRKLETFLSKWDVSNSDTEGRLLNLNDFPWGSVDSAGTLQNGDRYLTTSEPVLLFSDRLLPITEYTNNQNPSTRCILTSNKAGVLDSAYEVSQLVQRQKICLFTDHVNEAEYKEFLGAGIKVWRLSKHEICFEDEKEKAEQSEAFPLSKLFCAALMGNNLPETRIVKSALIESISGDLLRLRQLISDSEAHDAIVVPLQRIFWRAQELLTLPAGEYQNWLLDQTLQVQSAIGRKRAFLPPEAANMAINVTENIVSRLLPKIEEYGQTKATALVQCADHLSGRPLIIVRHATAREAIQTALPELNADILLYSELNAAGCRWKDAVIIGWPSTLAYQSIVNTAIADKVHAILYPDEEKALQSYFRNQNYSLKRRQLTPEEKCSITGIPEQLFVPNVQKEMTEQSSKIHVLHTVDTIFDVNWSIRPSQIEVASGPVRARLVSLCNDHCLYLEVGQRIPVITVEGQQYQRRKVDELCVGDMIVFRSSGREILREISEDMYGEGYNEAWLRALQWKDWLRSLGSTTTEVHGELQKHGLERHWVTVDNWLSNDELIGPQSLGDLKVIAGILGNITDHEVTAVAGAIQQIRRIHVQAGFRLTELLMQNLVQSRDVDTNASARFSDVKLFTVEDIDSEVRSIPASWANVPHPVWWYANNRDLNIHDLVEMIANG